MLLRVRPPVIRDERKIDSFCEQSSNSNSAFFTHLTVDDKAALCVTDNTSDGRCFRRIKPITVRSKHTPMILGFEGQEKRHKPPPLILIVTVDFQFECYPRSDDIRSSGNNPATEVCHSRRESAACEPGSQRSLSVPSAPVP